MLSGFCCSQCCVFAQIPLQLVKYRNVFHWMGNSFINKELPLMEASPGGIRVCFVLSLFTVTSLTWSMWFVKEKIPRVQLWSETLPAAAVKPPQQQCICMWWEAGKCCFSLSTWMNKKLRYKEIKKGIWRWISPKPSRVTHCSVPLKIQNNQVWLLGCLKTFSTQDQWTGLS